MRIEPSDLEGLRPLIVQIVKETLAQIEPATNGHGPEIYTEREAAAILKLRQHQLRDERRRGRVRFSYGPRRSIRYTRENIMDYLASRAG